VLSATTVDLRRQMNKKSYFLIDQQSARSIEQGTDQESLVTWLSQLKTLGDQFGN
jgi:hypothetical protein